MLIIMLHTAPDRLVTLALPLCAWVDLMGQQLKEIRQQRGMSLRELGRRVGIDYTTLSRIEAGKIRLASHHIAVLAPALGCDPADLVSEFPLTPKQRELIEALADKSDAYIDSLLNIVRSQD